MIRAVTILALATLAAADRPAEGQIVVSGAQAIVSAPPAPVVHGRKAVKARRPWRERNPYFAARPNYAPANNGARANVTFEPFTRWYYPNENSYYPPLDGYPSIRSR